MQLSGPVFLLIFLPLSFFLLVLFPRKYRLPLLAPISLLWYILANRENPAGILTVVALLLLAYFLVLGEKDRFPRLRMAFGVLVPFLVLLSSRLLAEYKLIPFSYPYGLTFISLSAISAVMDRLRGDAAKPQNFLEFSAYILFFPVLTIGPVLRYKTFLEMTEGMNISTERITVGIRSYMIGFVKRIAIAAVLMKSMQQIFNYGSENVYFFTVILMPIIAFFLFYCSLAGASDMARGVALILGFSMPKDRGAVFFCGKPEKLLGGFLLSFQNYINDYVGEPVRQMVKGKIGKVLAALSTTLLTALFFRTRVEMLLFALPFFAIAVWDALRPQQERKKRRYLHVPAVIFSYIFMAIFALAAGTPDPMLLFSILRHVSFEVLAYQFYYIYDSVSSLRYLIIGAILAVIFLPLMRVYPVWRRRMGKKTALFFDYGETVLLFAVFVMTLIFFMPQFPQYANLPFVSLFF